MVTDKEKTKKIALSNKGDQKKSQFPSLVTGKNKPSIPVILKDPLGSIEKELPLLLSGRTQVEQETNSRKIEI